MPGYAVLALSVPGSDAPSLAAHPPFLCVLRHGLASLARVQLGAVMVRLVYSPTSRDSVPVALQWGLSVPDCQAVLNGSRSTRRVLGPQTWGVRRSLVDRADATALQAEVQIAVEDSGLLNAACACADQFKEACFLAALQAVLVNRTAVDSALGPAVQAACTAQGLTTCPAPVDGIRMWPLTHQPCKPAFQAPDDTMLYLYIGAGAGGGVLLLCACVAVYRVRVGRAGGADMMKARDHAGAAMGSNPMYNSGAYGARPQAHVRAVLRQPSVAAGLSVSDRHAAGAASGGGAGTASARTGLQPAASARGTTHNSRRRSTIPDAAFASASPHVLQHLASRKMLFVPSQVRQAGAGQGGV